MTVPSFSVTSGHPRVFFRASEKTALTARTNDTGGWKTVWDNEITSSANSLKAKTDQQLGEDPNPHLRWVTLAFYGYIEETGRPVNGYKDKAIKGALFLCGANPPNPGNAYERFILIGLSAVFDICFDDMTTSEKNTIAAEILQFGNNMSDSSSERMDGWSGNDTMCKLAGALAVHGYSTFASSAQTQLTEALTFLYGSGTGANAGRLEMARYQYAGGGAEKGGMYWQLGIWCELWTLWMMAKGTDHDSWTQEASWAKKIWEWVIWTQYRGGASDDVEAHGDTNKAASPQFFVELRWALSILANQFPNPDGTQGGQMCRWLYDTYDNFSPTSRSNAIWDVIFLDKAAVTAVEPRNATTPPARQRLFEPPQTFYFRGSASAQDSWNYDQAVMVRESGRRWRWLGHFHLDGGALQWVHKGDVLISSPAGYYDLTVSSTGHYNNGVQRSWLQSGCPLIFLPGETYHLYSDASANDGGQQYKKFGSVSDPGNVWNMQNDAGGLAWLAVESFTKTDFVGAGSAASPEAVFTVVNLRRAYRKQHTDSDKVPICEVKTLYIRPTGANGLSYPCMIRYYRIQKTDSDLVTTIPWHSPNTVSTASYGANWTGYNTANSLSPAGKLWLDIRDLASYTRSVQTQGTTDSNGWGATQFQIPNGVGTFTTTNYKPLVSQKARLLKDCKKQSYYVQKTTQTQEEHYVFQLMSTDAADSQPTTIGSSWITDGAQPSYYGKTIGTTDYLIHRTLPQAVVGGGGPDTTPPANPTALAVAPRNKALLATWTDPADSDLDLIVVEYRTA